MRRFAVLTLAALALLGLVAPDAWAQAPTPTFKINGLIDQMMTLSSNTSNYDVDLRNRDEQWYARTRGRLDFVGEVGKAKAVVGIEIDLAYGQTGAADSSIPGPATQCFGCTGSLDLNTDVRTAIEVKWLYTEFPVPLMPVPTLMRLGAQPWGGAATYKLAALATGDFAGVHVASQITKNINLLLTYGQVEEGLTDTDGGIAVNQYRGDDFAAIVAVEIGVMKGLDIKPMYSLFYADGTTSGASRVGRGGINANTAFTRGTATAGSGIHEYRHTVGVDARWRWGGFSLDPTVLYQFGSRDAIAPAGMPGATAGRKYTADINAWLVDIRAGYQIGPVLLQGLVVFSTGNKGSSTTLDKVYYFQPISTDSSYLADWGTQLTSLGVDYFSALLEQGAGSAFPGSAIGWDKYGRQQYGLKATYAWTPTLSMHGGVSAHFTHRSVDTDGGVGGGNGITPNFAKDGGQGDAQYVGTELHGGVTWRFTPGVAFDLGLGYMFAGEALDAVKPAGQSGSAKDIYIGTGRVRFTF